MREGERNLTKLLNPKWAPSDEMMFSISPLIELTNDLFHILDWVIDFKLMLCHSEPHTENRKVIDLTILVTCDFGDYVLKSHVTRLGLLGQTMPHTMCLPTLSIAEFLGDDLATLNTKSVTYFLSQIGMWGTAKHLDIWHPSNILQRTRRLRPYLLH